MKLGILYERIRKDEKLLIEAAKKQGLAVNLLHDKDIIFKLEKKEFDLDIVLERCINHLSAKYAMTILNGFGITTVNSSEAADICGSKFLVTEALIQSKIPTPKVSIAFTKNAALRTIERMGYPVVLKPAIGSWGKLLAKINDSEAAEAVLDHKSNLGSYHHSVFYIQEYIDKPGRDIRVFVVGDKVAGAIYRSSKHWITHIDKGAKISKCELTQKIKDLALKSAGAVKGDIVAVDMLETKNGLLVLEVDYTPEFSIYFPYLDKQIINDVVDFLVRRVKQ